VARSVGRRAPAARTACKCSDGYAKLTTRIATVSRIATIASALLEISRSLMVSVLSILLDVTPRLKVYLVTFLSKVRSTPGSFYAPARASQAS
jgi:hypothetical protein